MAQALAIGGWLASEAVSMLSDTIRSFISGRYDIATGQSSKFQSLLESLAKIKAVIGLVESKCLTEDPNVVSWLNYLKDAVYDAEDMLDFINYHYVEASGNEGSSNIITGAFKKARKTLKLTLFPDDSLYDLSDVVNKFDRLSDDGRIGTFLKVIDMSIGSKNEDESFDRRQTSPLGEAKVFCGRKEMHELLIEELVPSNDNGSNGDNFSVVSIVGIGGVGKTTLAQWLYNHDRVKDHFNPKAWVCVSGKSNVGTIMMKIIESATRHPYNHTNFANIHEDLLRLLSKKRFLIVLDDVWDEIVTQWDKFISVFRHGKKGSKIVISTRNRIIADIVSSMHTINLEGLRDEEYWEFFRSCAFGNVEPKDHPKLEHIGKQIARKLGGLPLAAKAVGGVLKLRLEERHWRDVLENKEWQRHGEILPSLRLSYNILPAHLKQCFAYCALFPKDYVFSTDKLVHIWVAQGYVQSSYVSKTLEDVGREYFNELYSRCFFQDYNTFDGSPLNKYVIHDLLHDLAESILADEVYREENASSVENKIPKRVRHLFVKSSDLDSILDQIKEPKKLRSLVYDPPYTRRVSQTSYPDFKKLRRLRVLILGKAYSPSYLPETIGNMIHLRYMEFPLGIKLPISLGRLLNLQVLQLSSPGDIGDEYLRSYDPNRWFLSNFTTREIDDSESISHCFDDQTAMSKIFGKLTNLRYINEPSYFISAIPSIGKLTSLQRLTHFEVRKQVCYKMCELRNLNKLHGCLRIVNLENVADKEEAEKAELHNKAHLEALSLWWHKSDHWSNDEIRLQEEVLEGLQPHSNIKGIGISRYMGLKHPIWFNKLYLSNIECVSLFECVCLKALPPLWEFPFLKFLSLYRLTSLEIIGLEALGRGDKVFPLLQHLKMHSLNELREWPGFKENVRDLMPLLSNLEIINCNKLETLPPLGELPSLRHLHLSGLDLLEEIDIEVYGRGSTAFPLLEQLKLENLKELMNWSGFKEDVWMPLLSRLEIISCPKLVALPPLGGLKRLEWLDLEELGALKNIGIEMYGRKSAVFPNLKFLRLALLEGLEEWWGLDDNRSLMPNLTTLIFIDCPKLRVLPPLGKLPFLKDLHIEGLNLLDKIGTEIYGIERTAFPSLDWLILRELRELTDWRAVEKQGKELMPLLTDMEIIDCPKLERLIHDPFDFLNLRFGFENVDDAQMFHEFPLLSSLSRLTSLSLGPLKGLELFTAAQQEWLKSLTSLTSLRFEECYDLQRLPDILESFHRLEKLTLIECCAVVSLGQKSLPKNLKEFRLTKCGKVEKLCDWRQEGTEWNKISHIPLIKIGKELWDYEVIPQPASPHV